VAGVHIVPLTGVPIGVSGDDMDNSKRNDGGMTQPYTPNRPDSARRVWYTFGGGLGSRYREWVLHDVTSRRSRLRQAGRTLLRTATVGALAILVFGIGWITWVSLIGLVLLSLMYHGIFFDAFAEHRLFQHGYPWGTAQRVVNEHDRRATQRRYLQTNHTDATRQSAQPLGAAPGRLGRSHHPNMAPQLDQRSPRIGRYRVTGHAERSVVHYRQRDAGWVLDLDPIAVDREL
jgi:hypothetical protein